jgi:cell wall-associated NlpC family hydrolase
MKFYGHNDGHIQYKNTKTKTRLQSIATIYDYSRGKSVSDVNLQPGDIVTYYGQHTNIYLGTNSSGKKTWYDAGRWEIGTNQVFHNFLRTSNTIMQVSHVIRLK